MKAPANPYRLLILCRLHEGEQSVGALVQLIGLSQSALSQHLARLRRDGVVQTGREGQTIHYALASTKVARAVALLYGLYCGSHPAEAPTRETVDAA